jgi:hypothetical protein
MCLVQKEETSHELVFGRSGNNEGSSTVCGVGPKCTCLAAAKTGVFSLNTGILPQTGHNTGIWSCIP